MSTATSSPTAGRRPVRPSADLDDDGPVRFCRLTRTELPVAPSGADSTPRLLRWRSFRPERFCPDLGRRRGGGRSHRPQRQSECLDLVDARLQARLFRTGLGRSPWLDNKASFQRGINQAVRATAVELVDSLGRVRGTSGVNADLQSARGNIQFDEETWYSALTPLVRRPRRPSFYRSAMPRPQEVQRFARQVRGNLRRPVRQHGRVPRPRRQ